MVLFGNIAACSSKQPKMVAFKAVTTTIKLGKKASCLKKNLLRPKNAATNYDKSKILKRARWSWPSLYCIGLL